MTKKEAQALIALWGMMAANTRKTLLAVAMDYGKKTQQEFSDILVLAES